MCSNAWCGNACCQLCIMTESANIGYESILSVAVEQAQDVISFAVPMEGAGPKPSTAIATTSATVVNPPKTGHWLLSNFSRGEIFKSVNTQSVLHLFTISPWQQPGKCDTLLRPRPFGPLVLCRGSAACRRRAWREDLQAASGNKLSLEKRGA